MSKAKLASTLALMTVLAALMSLSCQPAKVQKLRIGSNQSVPFNYWGADGKPTGFSVETLRRAAEIAGYELEWVPTKQGPDNLLAAGEVDIWPFLTAVAERRKRFYVTEPWWSTATIMFFRAERNIGKIADLEKRHVVLTSTGSRFVPLANLPPSTKVEISIKAAETFQRMCRGEVDVAWVDFRVADAILLDRPVDCQQVKLGSLMVDQGARKFAMGARFGMEKEAKRLRAAIDQMAESGELVDIAERWKLLNKLDASFIGWMKEVRAKNEFLKHLFWGMIAALILTLTFVQRLTVARKLAESSALARSQFLANMSHEIRTPMNGILGMTELTLETDLNEDQRQCLTMAKNSAQGLLQILDDILDFSRIDSGKLSLELIAFDVRDVATRSIQMLSLAAQTKDVQLLCELDPAIPPFLRGDPGRIQQVLINLAGNAVKFTAQGSVKLRIGAESTGPGTWLIRFAVQDSGIGIAPAKQKQIFDAFTQADASTTRKFGGTGLGLAISSQLVEMMGGKLIVESVEGAGSTFSFELLMHETRDAKRAPLEREPGSRGNLKVLVVEDNAVNRALALRVLEKAGHRVETAVNGKEALDVLAERSFDAILMDIHMPVMDGLEATAKLRKREEASGLRTPVIALTALAIQGDVERCLAAGMDAYLSKPINTAQLLAMLANLNDNISPRPIAKDAAPQVLL